MEKSSTQSYKNPTRCQLNRQWKRGINTRTDLNVSSSTHSGVVLISCSARGNEIARDHCIAYIVLYLSLFSQCRSVYSFIRNTGSNILIKLFCHPPKIYLRTSPSKYYVKWIFEQWSQDSGAYSEQNQMCSLSHRMLSAGLLLSILHCSFISIISFLP